MPQMTNGSSTNLVAHAVVHPSPSIHISTVVHLSVQPIPQQFYVQVGAKLIRSRHKQDNKLGRLLCKEVADVLIEEEERRKAEEVARSRQERRELLLEAGRNRSLRQRKKVLHPCWLFMRDVCVMLTRSALTFTTE